MSKLKFYAAIFAVIIGLFTAFNQTAHGQTIINPSFETDNVPPAPGFGTITGWTGGSGINAANGPFTDNGTIPDGQKAAFIFGAGTMRQTVSGFTVGTQYRLRYYENVRNCCGARSANLQVTVGGATVVATHEVVAVGGTNPYVLKISEPFTATAQALEIVFITSGTGDYTVLLDKIEIGRNLIVTNNNDSGAGSLRQAVIDAPAGGAISFSNALSGTISLATGQIVIDKNLTIVGLGADRLTVRNGASDNIFGVNNGVTATISGLTIAQGLAGGIVNVGTLTVADCVVRDNQNGGISNLGGVLAVTNSNILHNSAGSGGGIYNNSGRLTITNSSITGNVATGAYAQFEVADPYSNGFVWGSAIANRNGSVTIINSTIAGNEDQGYEIENCYQYPGDVCPPHIGSAILMLTAYQGATQLSPELNLINSTVTDNILKIRDPFFSQDFSTVTARNSIINGLTNNRGSTSLISQGYNLIVYPSSIGIAGDTTGNILGANPRLGPLYYGGTTMTRALLTGSPAINAGNTATSPNTDQRGAARVGAADIGAFEVNNSANGGNFVVELPDAFTEISYSHLLVENTSQNNTPFTYSLTGGTLPTGISLSTTQFLRVLVSGRTAQTGVFAFSVTATDGTRSFVTDYRLRVHHSGAPPQPGGCLSNPVVANSSDSGEGTLRQAVMDACAGGTITFGNAVRGRIFLTNGPIEISKNLTLAGPGADALTIRNAAGNGPQNHVVHVNFGVTAVILSGLTISDGYADGGGGIFNAGNLTVRNAVITNNHSPGPGGGIVSGGTLTLVNSIVTGNGEPRVDPVGGYPNSFTQGGGIHFVGTSLTITDSTVSGNTANEGGGIYANYNSSVTITNSTIEDNYSYGPAGGLYLDGGMATLTNCTVSQNRANGGDGGGIFIRDGGALTLINSTVANNYATSNPATQSSSPSGGGIANGSLLFSGGTVNARNSIIAGNLVDDYANNTIGFGPDFYGTLTSQGYNLIGDRRNMTIVGNTTGNIVGTTAAPVNARLAPLGFYGGPTMTHALLTGSPAINAGNTATSPATDQRGAGRVGTADMGAFELNNSANGGNFVAQLPDGRPNVIYNYVITPNNGSFTFTVTGGTLPTGLSLTTNLTPNAVVALSGTPTQTGTFNFSITASNGTNSNVTNYTLYILAPTAASVSVSGRVLTGDGRGLQNAIVSMTDSSGAVRSTRSTSFGYFRFDDVGTGEIYVFQVNSKRYTFAPQVVTVTEELTELNFTAQ